MSRIGKKPIEIPQNVKVSLQGGELKVEGPKGKLSMRIHPDIKVSIENNTIKVERPTDQPFHRAMHGTTAALIRNMIKGVTEGFTKVLEVVGLGYRAAVKGSNLELSLGLSHPVIYPIPPLSKTTLFIPFSRAFLTKSSATFCTSSMDFPPLLPVSCTNSGSMEEAETRVWALVSSIIWA